MFQEHIWDDGFFSEIIPCQEKYVSSSDRRMPYEITSSDTWFIIDWDDTLLPTSQLARRGVSLDTAMLSDELSSELEAVDSAVSTFLQKITAFYGKILIITNAQKGWVELSSEKFLPLTHEILFAPENATVYSFSSSSSGFNNDHDENCALNLPNFSLDYLKNHVTTDSENESCSGKSASEYQRRKRLKISSAVEADDKETKVAVFSAREMYEKAHPDNPSLWKVGAFRDILSTRIPESFRVKEGEEQKSKESRRPRGNSTLSTLDLSGLVEIDSSFEEIEMEFKDSDSFYSIDFYPSDSDEFEDFTSKVKYDLQPNEKEVTSEQMPACNLISIGDCRHDCESLFHLDLNLKNCLKKTVKLREMPSFSQLIRELQELNANIHNLVKSTRDVHLVVNKSHG